MACLLTGGFTKGDCGFLLGGLAKLYIANSADVVSITDSTPLTGVLDTIVMDGAAVWYAFQFEKDTASFTQELQVSNGNRYVMQTLVFSLAGQGVEVVKILAELSLGNFIAIAETRTGVRTVLGLQNGLEATGGSNFNSGAAAGDFGGAVITLVGEEAGFGAELDPATVIPV